MKLSLLLLLLLIPPVSNAAIINAISPAISDVQAAISGASNGDTVVIPSNVPTGGTWSLTFDGSTAQVIPSTAYCLEIALNTLPSIVGAGGLTVTGSMANGFKITFNNNGARNPFIVDASLLVANGLANLSASVIHLNTGTSSTKDVQLIAVGNSWTSALQVTKNITIQGQTTVTGTLGNYVVTDNTRILFDVPNTGTNDQRAAFNITLASDALFRISGLTFWRGSLNVPANVGILRLGGKCNSVRIDHCHFYHTGGNPVPTGYFGPYMIEWDGWLYGVADHNRIESDQNPMDINHPTWNEGNYSPVPAWGDGSWADPAYLSSEKFFFAEDNELVCLKIGTSKAASDGTFGARIQARHNYCVDLLDFQNHGTESSGRIRSGRAMVVYGNTFTYPTIAPAGMIMRGGTGIWYDNVFNGAKVTSIFGAKAMRYYRQDWPAPTWNGADGSNPWDSNDTSDNSGNVYGGGTNGLYASGTHTGGNGSTMLIVAVGSAGNPAPGWTINQWAGYTLKNNTTSTLGTNFAPIASNTINSITYLQDEHNADFIQFNTGDSFSIRKVISGIDQVGAGQGDLISGSPVTINTVTGTQSYPRQTSEPWYGWHNSITTTTNVTSEAPMSSNCYFVKENRDYYATNASWITGQPLTTGVATGALADRPAECTKGVGYWASDQGALYQCGDTNTWTQYYQPYTYPHPLTTGFVPSPTPSPTPTSTATATPTATSTFTPTPTPSFTPTPSATFTPLPTATATSTPPATPSPTCP